MTEWADTAAVLLAFSTAMHGPMRCLREALPSTMRPDGPNVELFEGNGTGGAGMSVFITARHEDGRGLYWQVQLWADREQESGRWWANVTGEIDLDDDEGDDKCVLNERREVANGAEAAESIRELAEMVSQYPLEQLLALRWGPGDDWPLDVSR